MKLSEIKGERALEVIADIMDPISNLVNDPETKKAFKSSPNKPIIKILPEIIKKHKNDVYNMLAILEGVPVEEYIKNATISKLLQDFADVITDESIQSLFTSAKPGKAKN